MTWRDLYALVDQRVFTRIADRREARRLEDAVESKAMAREDIERRLEAREVITEAVAERGCYWPGES